MKKTLFLLMSLVIALSLHACSRKNPTDDRVIAKVAGKPITVADFHARISKLPPYYQSFVEKNKKRYLEDIMLESLFYEEAMRRGIGKDQETRDVINEAKKKIIIAKLIKIEVEDKVNLSEEEMKAFYEAHKDEFKTPEMWRASHILVNTEKEAKEVQDELGRGASFDELAKARSTDATASRGGDVGFFRQGQVVPDFEKVCMKLKVGETSDIVHTQFGYHIIKLTDKRDQGTQSFAEAKASTENELKRKQRGELFNNLVSKLKDKYGVEIKEDVFISAEEERPGKPGTE